MVSGTPDPCRLLPTASVAAVLGDPPPAPKTSIEPEAPLNHRQCEWKVPSDDFTGKVIYLSVTTTEGMKEGGAGGGSYTAKNLYDDTLVLYAGAVDVPGLGDGALDAADPPVSVAAGADVAAVVVAASSLSELQPESDRNATAIAVQVRDLRVIGPLCHAHRPLVRSVARASLRCVNSG